MAVLALLQISWGTGCSSSRPVTVEDLRYQSVELPDGQALSTPLADTPLKLLFGGIQNNGRLWTSIAFRLPGADDMPHQFLFEGTFDPGTCTFRIRASKFHADAEGILPGRITTTACLWDPKRGTLSLDRNGEATVSGPARKLYSFVVVLTDDQRWDTLPYMPLLSQLSRKSVVFDRAYTTIPICCPFRASFLAGGVQAHYTNVLTNQWPNGGAERFDDSETLATELFGLGYRTGLFGKYLNGHSNVAPRIPHGWTEFVANLPGSNTPERSWFDFYVLEGSRWSGHSRLRPHAEGEESGFISRVEQYSPYYYGDRVLSFLERADGSPFFAYLALRAPHTPATPAPEDADFFPHFSYRHRAYAESDVSDKPEWVRVEATRFDMWKQLHGDIPRKTLQSLQAVDRVLASIYRKLQDLGRLEDTVIFFTSDSGFHWLEHRISYKASPYEEALRVPFIALYPGTLPRTDDHLVAVNLDIPATILELVGSTARTDGMSLEPHLASEPHDGRPFINFEHYPLYYSPAARRANPDRSFLERYFSGLRVSDSSGEWKYVEHYNGETELYDLARDPYEEHNLDGEVAFQGIIERLSLVLRPWKGLGITTPRLPDGVAGKPYSAQVTALGGDPPYSWAVIEDRVPGLVPRRRIGPELDGLPDGLVLDERTGLLQGMPEKAGTWEFVIQVKDSGQGHRSGGHQSFYEHLSIHVAAR